jgi:hypothetical protein
MQRKKLPLSYEEALLHQTLLSEISEQAEDKRAKDQQEVLQEMKQEEKNEAPAGKTRNWVTACFLFVMACLLPFICRIISFRKRGPTVGERARSAPEKEQRAVTV